MNEDEPTGGTSPPSQGGWTEGAGKTVADATAAAAERLGAAPEELEVEVLEEPQRGLLGLGGRDARVRARRRPEKAGKVRALAEDVVRTLGLGEGTTVTVGREEAGYLRVSITGPNLGILIGRRGETLDALQYLLNLAAARMDGPAERVILDAGGYRDRRRVTLERLAERVAETVRRTGREMVLEPMTPQERKVIHVYLAGEEGVRSESRGEDPFRRIVVLPSGTEAGFRRGEAGGADRDEDGDEDSDE